MKNKAIKIVISSILYLIALVFKFNNQIITNSLFFTSYIIVGFEILRKAIRNFFKGKIFDENFLMGIATIGAFFINEFAEAVAVMLFYQIGELFQNYAVGKSRKSISKLMEIKPDYANIIKDGIETKVEPEEVKVNDIIVVKPGEKVPLDGIIIEGEALIDTRALTGESIPKRIGKDEEILSGTVNTNSMLKIKVTKEFEESTVNKILELVENASSKKSKSENFITKFARVYTPLVVIIALFLAIIPTLIIKNTSFSIWLYRALSFLVVSCPCALVISVPLSFFGGIGGAAKKGILIKGSNYLEAIANTEIIVFDKTGTLTEGVFEVQKINTVDITKEKLLEMVAHAENYSNHPIAKSLKDAYGKEIETSRVKSVKEISGHGINAIVDENEVLIGNEKLMNKCFIKFNKSTDIGTIVYIAINKEYKGYIVIADRIKKDAFELQKKLEESNLKKVVMLTGDRLEIAQNVANTLKIKELYAELLPDDKVKKVEELLKQKTKDKKLVFIGDRNK